MANRILKIIIDQEQYFSFQNKKQRMRLNNGQIPERILVQWHQKKVRLNCAELFLEKIINQTTKNGVISIEMREQFHISIIIEIILYQIYLFIEMIPSK